MSSSKEARIRKVRKMVERNIAKCRYTPLGRASSALIRDAYAGQVADLGLALKPMRDVPLALSDGSPFATTYECVVIGDYGPYIELTTDQIVATLHVPGNQEWRLKPGREFCVCRPLKYEWWETTLGDKVYKQRGRVRYADYKVGYYYISPFSVRRSQ